MSNHLSNHIYNRSQSNSIKRSIYKNNEIQENTFKNQNFSKKNGESYDYMQNKDTSNIKKYIDHYGNNLQLNDIEKVINNQSNFDKNKYSNNNQSKEMITQRNQIDNLNEYISFNQNSVTTKKRNNNLPYYDNYIDNGSGREGEYEYKIDKYSKLNNSIVYNNNDFNKFSFNINPIKKEQPIKINKSIIQEKKDPYNKITDIDKITKKAQIDDKNFIVRRDGKSKQISNTEYYNCPNNNSELESMYLNNIKSINKYPNENSNYKNFKYNEFPNFNYPKTDFLENSFSKSSITMIKNNTNEKGDSYIIDSFTSINSNDKINNIDKKNSYIPISSIVIPQYKNNIHSEKNRKIENVEDIYKSFDTNEKNEVLNFFNENKDKHISKDLSKNEIPQKEKLNANNFFFDKINTESVYLNNKNFKKYDCGLNNVNTSKMIKNIPITESIIMDTDINNNFEQNESGIINSQCYDNILEVLFDKRKKNDSKNKKLFSLVPLTKSYSTNIEDYLLIKENIINKEELIIFKESLTREYETQFDIFYYNLKKCKFSNLDIQYNKVGPISSLEHYIEYKFSDFLKANKPIMQIELLEKTIYRWRNICGDGNCFYRAVMFSYLEYILINNKNEEFLNLIKQIHNFILMEKFRELFEKNNIDYKFLLKALFFILYIYENKIKYEFSKYEMFIILLNNCRDVDLGLVFFLRIKIWEFIEANKEKIYSREFNVKMGNLLSEKYQGEDENHFLWDKFYEENLLKLFSDAENIIIYVTPLILNINLKIFTFEIGNNICDKFNLIRCHLPDRHTAFLFYRKIHYDLIYSKEYFEIIQNNIANYFDVNYTDVDVEKLKNQAISEVNYINKINSNQNEETEIDNQNDNYNNINKDVIIENPDLIDLNGYNFNIESNVFENNNNMIIDKDNLVNRRIHDKKLRVTGNNQYNKIYNIHDFNHNHTNIKSVNNKDIEQYKQKNNNKINNINSKKFSNSLMEKNKIIDFYNIDIEKNILNTENNNLHKNISNNFNKTIFLSSTEYDNTVTNRTKNNNNANTCKLIKEYDMKHFDEEENKKNYDSSYDNDMIKNNKKHFDDSVIRYNNIADLKDYGYNLSEINSFRYENNKFLDTCNIKNTNSIIIDTSFNDDKDQNFSIKCKFCKNLKDELITNFMSINLCLECVINEIKSFLLINVINKSIVFSLNSLLNHKIFRPFDEMYDLNENNYMAIFEVKKTIKEFKEHLKVDFKKLIKDNMRENCLMCFLDEYEKKCQPKNFIFLPCNCRFDSINHFSDFLKNLIILNEKYSFKLFFCLCNKEYNFLELLIVFEIIHSNKLIDEFYLLKNFVIDKIFNKFCFKCGKNINLLNKREKISIDFSDIIIKKHMHITKFNHFACQECLIFNKIHSNLKHKEDINEYCFLCGIPHEYLDSNYDKIFKE